MTAIHLHLKEHVGTTYKRALERFHLSRDGKVPRDFSALQLIDPGDNWSVRTLQWKDTDMRKPRDFDAEMKALTDRARQLRTRKVQQLGELVIACRADALPVEQLAGALLAAAATSEAATQEAWRKSGAAFFQGKATAAQDSDRTRAGSDQARGGAAPPATADASAQ
jgi:hypothetical protein